MSKPRNQVIIDDAIGFIKSLRHAPRVIITDPPYGKNYKSGIPGDKRWNANKKAKRPVKRIKNDESLKTVDYLLFFETCYRKLDDEGFLFLFCNDKALLEWVPKAIEAGFDWKDTLFWDKKVQNGGDISWPFQQVVELVVCLIKGKPKTYELRSKFGELINKRANIFNIGRICEEEKCGHPTQKPLLICQELIRCSTQPNEFVVDPFCGSGTTILAAKLMGRTYAGCDIDPEHVKRTQERLKTVTQSVVDTFMYKYIEQKKMSPGKRSKTMPEGDITDGQQG